MTHQLALTVIVDLIPGREEEARAILREMNADPSGRLLPFAKVPSVHFARLFILDETKDLRGVRLPAQLILMSDVDAPERLYWDDLRAMGEGLEGVPIVPPGFRLIRFISSARSSRCSDC